MKNSCILFCIGVLLTRCGGKKRITKRLKIKQKQKFVPQKWQNSICPSIGKYPYRWIPQLRKLKMYKKEQIKKSGLDQYGNQEEGVDIDIETIIK